ncbi:hypothetical protein K438DRAFT_1757031 [Mycena galopus ATCC 62051]|nr:hypothetical protein K438DRAFT_1757031 [Mycena galopus ATCC 62051]
MWMVEDAEYDYLTSALSWSAPRQSVDNEVRQSRFAGVGGYCISKAAFRSLTQMTSRHHLAIHHAFIVQIINRTARELREHGVAVGGMMTADPLDKEHGKGFATKRVHYHLSLLSEYSSQTISLQFIKIPDVRTGQPADVANVVSFLHNFSRVLFRHRLVNFRGRRDPLFFRRHKRRQDDASSRKCFGRHPPKYARFCDVQCLYIGTARKYIRTGNFVQQ